MSALSFFAPRSLPPDLAAKTRSLTCLSLLCFALADVRDGLGPFLGIFLQSHGWTPDSIGYVMTIGGLAGMAVTAPLGALADATRRKRLLLALASLGIVAALLAPLLFLPLPLWGRLLFLAVIVVTGGLAATRAEILLGRTDPGEVVIDELVGVWIALLPLGAGQWSWPGLVWAFALFRLFDIWKPWPVHASENWLPAGWGIMLDDILAGLMAMCCMLVLRALGWV